jgi:outer membrane protein OmpA-like peptidoglycan-associated protein
MPLLNGDHMRLRALLIVLMMGFGFGINAFAKKSDNNSKQTKSESTLNQEFQLKKEFEVDTRSRKISILNKAANCINFAVDKTVIQSCIKEEKNDLDALKSWEKEQKALYKLNKPSP